MIKIIFVLAHPTTMVVHLKLKLQNIIQKQANRQKRPIEKNKKTNKKTSTFRRNIINKFVN